MPEPVEERWAEGDVAGALAQIMDEIRAAPAAIAPRMALFQLACVVGDWQRAKKQLEAIARLDPEAAMMAQAYGAAIDAEATRRAVFEGRERPVCLGEPPAFVAMLAEALALDAQGEGEAAGTLRRHALEAAEPVEGTLNGTPFAWIMDADLRLGPVIEAIVQGQYRWLPFSAMRELRADPPKDVKDLIWAAVRVMLANGGELAALVPVRYPGSEASPEAALRLARATTWRDTAGGQQGLGQRLLATDAADHPFLELRRLRLGTGHA